MSDDLKKRLLDWEMWDEGDINDAREEAHARIEELCILHREYEKILTERIEELEQMLARAVEALEKIEAGLPAGSSLFDGKNPLWRDAYRDLQRVARATLAELNGETDE